MNGYKIGQIFFGEKVDFLKESRVKKNIREILVFLGKNFEKVGFHQGITCENESLVKKVKSVKIGQNLMSLKFAVMMIYG